MEDILMALMFIVGFIVLMSFIIFLWFFKFGGKELMKEGT